MFDTWLVDAPEGIDAPADAPPDAMVDAMVDAMPDAMVDAAMPDADVTGPMLATSDPLANATNVPRTSTITVVFTEGVVNVSTTTFTVSRGANAVSGTVSATSATTYVFTPTNSLTPNATITVRLDGAITDASGNALVPAPTTFSFQVN